ncbi:MAG: hypothetical protein JNL40_02715 [Cyclobacteriaceae bacterium]|nr:hypothetical protein [Cyclobacteriaceae bacterium]
MKKNLVILLAVLPILVFAQVKPSIPKAEKALREGKIDEAKTIIDATTGSQEFMVDKKGQPSKNAAKAWFLRGLIYSAIDSTKKEQFKSLEADPFAVAKDAFEKSKALDPTSVYFLTDPNGLPLLNENAKSTLGYVYYNKAITAFNEKGDPKKVLDYAEKTLYYLPNDTSFLFYTGGVFAPAAGEVDKGISLLEEYFKKGGKLPEVYAAISNVYIEQKKDNATALKWIKEGQAKYPAYRDLRLLELNIYLTEKKYDVAKAMVEKELAADPSNRDNYFLYGQLNRELGESDKAKTAFKKCLEIDPKYFDAATELANLYWQDAKKFKDEMGKLGNSKADLEKMKAIDAKYVEALKVYIPYIEACEKLSPDDVTVLYSLLNVYGDLDDQPKIARVKKRLKALGEDVN